MRDGGDAGVSECECESVRMKVTVGSGERGGEGAWSTEIGVEGIW